MIYKAMSVIFPVLIVSYASRKLGASGIGEVSSAQNIVTYFTMIAALGIPSYGVRSIAQTKHNKEICNKTFTELFVINLCSSIVCTLLYFILLNGMNLPITKLNYIFASLIILNICNVEWVYEGFEKYPFIAIRSFIVKGISLLLMFIFVRNKTDTVAYAIIVCFGTVGNYILNIVNLPSYVHLINGGKSCMAGFVLKNTLSDNGGVTRGICKMDAENNLTEVVETKNIVKCGSGAEADGQTIDAETLVSMNMWGLTPDFLEVLENGFEEFFEKDVKQNPTTAEYLIPVVIGQLLNQGKISVKVLKSNDTWYGMTYKEDVASVKLSFKKMLENGAYKADLFSDLK